MTISSSLDLPGGELEADRNGDVEDPEFVIPVPAEVDCIAVMPSKGRPLDGPVIPDPNVKGPLPIMGTGGEGFTTDEFSLEPEAVTGVSVPTAAEFVKAVCTGTVKVGSVDDWAVGVGVELGPLLPSPQPLTINPKTITSTPKEYLCMPWQVPLK